jgi:hypothetical protein
MSKVKPELISIFSMKVINSDIHPSELFLNKPVNPEGIKVGIAQETGFNSDEKNIRIRLNIHLDACDKEKNPIGLQADFGFEFQLHVENMDEIIEKKEDKTIIDGQFNATILSIAYSTARGILFERTCSTYFNGVILPVINPTILLKENFVE